MKMQQLSHALLMLIPLVAGAFLPSLCFAESTAQSPSPEAAAKPATLAGTLTGGLVPQTPPPQKTTDNSSDLPIAPNMFLSLWQSLNLTSLWTENSLFAWAMLLIWIFAGMLLGNVVSLILQRIAPTADDFTSKILHDLAGPANLALITLGIFLGLAGLNLDLPKYLTLKTFSNSTIILLFTIAVFWYLYNLIGLVDILLYRLSRNSDSELDKQLAPIVRRTLRVFLIILTVMFVVKTVFDEDIGAWLTGLGIAGIAVSLAAQDSLKNLFGSITIILDRPFKIGDRIICTGYDGMIEDIGFRSTKVRTTAGHLVSIPNANVVNSPIENISQRSGIRRSFSINLASDTPPDKVRQAAKIVRDLLEDKDFREPIHPHLNGEASVPQVAFGDFVNNNLLLTIAYWYAPAKSAEFAQHSEKLNLRILEEFGKVEIRLSAAK